MAGKPFKPYKVLLNLGLKALNFVAKLPFHVRVIPETYYEFQFHSFLDSELLSAVLCFFPVEQMPNLAFFNNF